MKHEIVNEIKGEMGVKEAGGAENEEKLSETAVSSVQCSVFSKEKEAKLEIVRPHLCPLPQERMAGSDTPGCVEPAEKGSVLVESDDAAPGPADTGALREKKSEPPDVGCYEEEGDDEGIVRFRSYQREVFEDTMSGIVVLHWWRQIGKSYVLAALSRVLMQDEDREIQRGRLALAQKKFEFQAEQEVMVQASLPDKSQEFEGDFPRSSA